MMWRVGWSSRNNRYPRHTLDGLASRFDVRALTLPLAYQECTVLDECPISHHNSAKASTDPHSKLKYLSSFPHCHVSSTIKSDVQWGVVSQSVSQSVRPSACFTSVFRLHLVLGRPHQTSMGEFNFASYQSNMTPTLHEDQMGRYLFSKNISTYEKTYTRHNI
jgi:hypothetical protein